MLIYFLRHGEAEEHPSLHDSERPLTDAGNRQATAAGQLLKGEVRKVELILTSPLLRARQTAESVQHEIGTVSIQPTEHLVSSSNPRKIIQELQKIRERTVLLVGHEPHLSETIALLLAGASRSIVEMKKCSLACVSTPDPVKDGSGILRWLIPSSQMIK